MCSLNINNVGAVFLIMLNGLPLILTVDVDPLGYIAYCPCMGRFGNQADHFLGALGFAHGLNRTLVLPPWVEYRYGESKSTQVPFDTYFDVDALREVHKVITMEKFMSRIAPIEWPPERRISFCYMSRGDAPRSCNAKEGNPFGPFWDTFNVDFVGSELYEPLHYDTINYKSMAHDWLVRYPPALWPVLAFTGAPASFPVQEYNRHYQKYLKWSPRIDRLAADFVATFLPKGAFIGIHLRNGIDWVRACNHIPQSPNLFAAAQCVGYRNERGKATADMCLPTHTMIIRQLKRTVKSYNQRHSSQAIKSVYVSSDNNHMMTELQDALQRMHVQVVKYPTSDPHVDLAILGRSNHFIGNCISSFSAFVKRERDAFGFPSSFWAFPTEKTTLRDEL